MQRLLPVVAHGGETPSLTLRQEHRMRAFKNRVSGKTFGPKREKVKRGLGKSYKKFMVCAPQILSG
jgi:hypothetical protein